MKNTIIDMMLGFVLATTIIIAIMSQRHAEINQCRQWKNEGRINVPSRQEQCNQYFIHS